jgi:membrane protein DedA with SNARE-associated domain
MELLIVKYGYIVIFIGTFFEGETILIIAGFLSHGGYLHLPLVIAAALAGSFSGDQLYFFIGRYRGQKVLEKRPEWRARVDKFMRLFNRYNIVIILSFRFLYGLRTISPFAIGLSNISALRFFLLNFISAVVWAISFGVAGYFFGHAVEIFMRDIKKYEITVVICIALIAILITLFRTIRSRYRSRIEKQKEI